MTQVTKVRQKLRAKLLLVTLMALQLTF